LSQPFVGLKMEHTNTTDL